MKAKGGAAKKAKKGLTYKVGSKATPRFKKAVKKAAKDLNRGLGVKALKPVKKGKKPDIRVAPTSKKRQQRSDRSVAKQTGKGRRTVAASYASNVPATQKEARKKQTVIHVDPRLARQSRESLAGAKPPIKPKSVGKTSKPKNLVKGVAAHELQHALGVTHRQMQKVKEGKAVRTTTSMTKPAKQQAYSVSGYKPPKVSIPKPAPAPKIKLPKLSKIR